MNPATPSTTPPALTAPQPRSAGHVHEVAFVMPCLNEAQTIEACIRAAQACIAANNLDAEIVIGDNGSTDGSQDLARRAGARVVNVPRRGYGAALMGAIDAANARSIIMGDADLSYDFSTAMPFVEKLREGYDLVMGNRFAGGIMPGAMPWKNRYIGNPALSFIGRVLFRCPVRDFHCGLRAFCKDAYTQLGVRTTGMEFASELAIKATLRNQRITEVPITLHPDGRSRPPHLRPWRDGWRHLRFMLLLAPLWSLTLPGLSLISLGLLLAAPLAFGPVSLGSVTLDVHTLLAAGLMVIVGYQALTIGLAARIFSLTEEIGPPSPGLSRAFTIFTFERGLLAGALLSLAGIAWIVRLTAQWAASDFGDLDAAVTLRPLIIAAVLTAVGAQTVLMSFFYSMLGIQRKD